jgi:hypothetical protein
MLPAYAKAMSFALTLGLRSMRVCAWVTVAEPTSMSAAASDRIGRSVMCNFGSAGAFRHLAAGLANLSSPLRRR